MSTVSAKDSVRELEVQWGDLDSIGIVFYPHFFSWADEGAHALFRAAGLALDGLLRDRSLSFGLVSATADFHSPARYADALRCRSSVSKLGSRSVELTHRIVRVANQSPVATVRETRVCMDLHDPGRIRACELPANVASGLRRYESSAATD